MDRIFMLTLIVLLGLFFLTTPAVADIDCSPLDPRASLSKEMEGKVNASVNTLYRIAKGSASVGGRLKEEIHNLQKEATVTEQGLIKLRTLYLYCSMVANAKDISTERKVELFNKMMEISEPEKPIIKQKTKSQKSQKGKSSSPIKGASTTNNDGQDGATFKTDQQPNNKTNITGQVSVVGGDYVAGNKTTLNIGLTEADREEFVRKIAREFKSSLEQKYQDDYTVVGIKRNGVVVPKGLIPEGIIVSWQTGAAKYTADEIMLVLPEIVINRANSSVRVSHAVIRGLSTRVNYQIVKLISTPDLDIELEVLGIDKELITVGLGFPLSGNQTGHGGVQNLTISDISVYSGGPKDYEKLLKDYPEISSGRKSIMREIVGDILGIDFVIKANAFDLIIAFSKVSKDIDEMRDLHTHFLNGASLTALTRPTRIIDENHQLTQVGVTIFKSIAKDMNADKEKL